MGEVMNRDEILAMAKEARVSEMGLNIDGSIHLLGLFERFADLVAAKEREACAQVCDAKAHEVRLWCNESNVIACAAAIRARGQKEGV